MDANRFDELTRSLAEPRSRRTTLKSLAAASAGLFAAALGRRAEAAARCRATGVVCSKNADCCGNVCNPKDNLGRRYCGGCDQGQHDCSGTCCPNGFGCDPLGGCCAGPGSVGTGGVCGSNSDCCNGSCNSYGLRCYVGCIPAGDETGSGYGCCSFGDAYYSGNSVICSDGCVANGLEPWNNNSEICCTGYIDQNNLCATSPG